MGSLPALLRKGYHIRALAPTAILGIPLLPSICPWSINQLRQIDSAVKVILHAAAIESGTQVALPPAQAQLFPRPYTKNGESRQEQRLG